MAMEKNVCGADRKIRALLGIALAVVAVKALEREQARRGTALWFAAVELLFNALAQFCFVNRALGINTCREQRADEAEVSPTRRLRRKAPL